MKAMVPIQGWSDITVHEMVTATIRDTSDLSLAAQALLFRKSRQTGGTC